MRTPRCFHSSNRLVGWLIAFVLAGGLLGGPISRGCAEEPMTPQDTLRALRAFRELGSVLYVAAHPDDENTQLIAYLARTAAATGQPICRLHGATAART